MHKFSIEKLCLLLILLLGGLLRFWNIASGLPDLYVHDEIFEVHRALELLRGEYNFYRTKGMFYLLLALVSGIYGLWLIAMGSFANLGDFVSHFIVHPGDIVFLSRVTTASLGTFSIYLMYLLSRRLFPGDFSGPRLLLPLGWSTCGMSVWLAKWGLIETALVTFGILAFFPILRILHAKRLRDYVYSGLLIAAATATKLYGVMLLLPFSLSHFLSNQWASDTPILSKLFHRKLMVALLVFVCAVVILSPELMGHYLRVGLNEGMLPTIETDTPKIFTMPYYLNALRWNLGNGMLPFLLFGMLVGFKRLQKDICIIVFFALAFFIALGLRKESLFIADRYLLLSLPMFFIVLVYGVEVVREKVLVVLVSQNQQKLVSSGVVVIVGCVMAWNGMETLLANPLYQTSFSPAREKALCWVEQHIPPGSKVVLRGEQRPWPGNSTLPLYDLREHYLKQYETVKNLPEREPSLRFLLDLAHARDVNRYDLIMEDRYAIWKDPEAYIKMGAEYFLVNVEYFQGQIGSQRSLKAAVSRQEFYRALQASHAVQLRKRFEGKTLQGGVRTIEVYQVVPSSSNEVFP